MLQHTTCGACKRREGESGDQIRKWQPREEGEEEEEA